MLFKNTRFIISFLVIGLATQSTVEGLQCYVCEDCNEYEDFKELHICGELPIVVTMKPVTLPEIIQVTTNMLLTKPTTKPVLVVNSEEYIYDDSDEKHVEKNITKLPTIKTRTATESTVTIKPNINAENASSRKPTTLASILVTQNKPLETTLTVAETKLISATVSTTTAAKPKPVQLPDYDDYLEYEDPIVDARSNKSLLKINQPVCYMFKYHVNNIILTNRGCTTFINSNKYLTCQSLYNGAPMSSCRICSTNGCNKFLSDYSEEDDHGILLNDASAFDNFKIVMVSIYALVVRTVLGVVL